MRGVRRYFYSYVAITCLFASNAQSEIVVDLATYPDYYRIQANAIGESFFFVDRCDINGDRIPDLIASASEASGPGESRPLAGEVYVIYGARKRWSGTTSVGAIHNVIVYGRTAGDNFGSRIGCGDTNGDGYDDLVVGASSADSTSGSRIDSGQAHIVLGSASLPAVIDLAISPHTTLWSAGAGYNSGTRLGVGDINGDGLADVIVNARNAPGRGGTPANTGRAYVVFGRTTWPTTIDLATQSSVVIYGADANDRITSEIAVGDLNRDGTAELLVGAQAASGPGNSRPAVGEISVFRGRASWPTEIDLKTSAPDTLILGADNFDGFGGSRGVRIGDIDNDGSADVALGATQADGPTNSTQSIGECRIAEFGSSFPAQLDLRTSSQFTVFGAGPDESFGGGVELADVNADGIDDLWIGAVQADGPNEMRLNAGETQIVFGGVGLPAVLDLSIAPADLIIYGGVIDDRLASLVGIDINDDGVAEITGNTSLTNLVRLTSLWLLSPFDTDGDGFTQLVDNCPLVSNPSQNDLNADNRGDACATDWDGDGQADLDDCAPSRALGGTPGAVTGLRFGANYRTRLEWNSQPFSNRYDVTRMLLPQSTSSDFGECITAGDPNPTDTELVDTLVPSPGSGFGYIVRGWNAICSLPGTWGTTSSGTERINSNPNRCP